MKSEAQEEFDRKYITSSEVALLLGVGRSTVHHARREGRLPNAIMLPGQSMALWVRDDLQPHLAAWRRRRFGEDS